jgi:hypothetical protein
MKKWQITLLVTIIIFIIGLAGAGWSQRPIIDYYMDGLEDSFTFHGYSMTANLKYRNRGSTDASLKLVVTVTNANITVEKPEPWIEYNETQVKFNTAAISHMDTYSSYAVNISPVGDTQNFTIRYTIEDTSNGWSTNGMISHLFLEPHGYFPTYAVYNRTDTDTYEWLK